MTVVAVVVTPLVLLYQGWSYWVFRARVTDGPGPGRGRARELVHRGATSLPATRRSSSAAASAGSSRQSSCKSRRRRHHARRAHQPPPLPAAALPGGDRHPLPRRRGAAVCARCSRSTTTSRFGSVRSPASTWTPGPSTCEHPASSSDLPYDYLIFGIGVGSSYFGHPEFAPHAPTMKTVDDALALRIRIFGAFEMAALAHDEDERRAWLTFAVVGGGPTGVEVAGQIAELAHRSLDRNFREFDPSTRHRRAVRGRRRDPADVRRPALRQGDARAHPPRRRRTGEDPGHRRHPRRDHRLRLPTASSGLACRTKVWAAGVAASPLARSLPEARAPRSTVPDGSRCCRTAPSPVTPRSTSSAT